MSKTVNPWKNVTIVKPTLNPLLNMGQNLNLFKLKELTLLIEAVYA